MAQNEKSLSIVVKARDEASAKMRKMQKGISKGFKDAVLPFLAIGAAVASTAKAVASGFELSNAKAAQAAAQTEQNLSASLEAQVKINDAWAKFGAAVPVIGGEVERIMRVLANTEAITKQIEEAKKWEATLKSVEKTINDIAREQEILTAQMKGATEEQIKQLKIQQENKKLQGPSEQLKADIEGAKEQLRLLKETKKERERAKGGSFGFEISLIKDLFGAESEADLEKRTNSVRQELGRLREVLHTHELSVATLIKSREKVADKAQEATKKIADASLGADIESALSDSFNRQLTASNKFYDDLITRAKDAGKETIKLEKAKAKAFNQIWDDLATKEKAILKQREDRELAAAKKIADKKEKEAKTVADFRKRLEDELFAGTHSKRENDIRKLEEFLKEKRKLFADDADILAKLDKIEKLRRKEIKDSNKKDDKGPQELQATVSRFLGSASGRENPAWVSTVTGASKAETKRIIEALKKLAPEIASAMTAQFTIRSLN